MNGGRCGSSRWRSASSPYLVVAGVRQIVAGDEPGESPAGIVFLGVVVMFGLARWKRRVGTALASAPFRAEASITFLDGCPASSILAALVVNAAFDWWWADPLAAGVIGVVAAHSARRAWAEAARRTSPVPCGSACPRKSRSPRQSGRRGPCPRPQR